MSMFETRINNLQDMLSEHEIDALLITSTYNIAYLTGILAFSIEEREARILITKDSAYLFTDARYVGMARKLPFITLLEINYSNPFSKQINNIIKEEKIKSLGFEEESISYKEAADLEENIKVEYVPTIGIIEDLRTIKDNDEIEKIKKACLFTDNAFAYILKELKPGQTETEVKILLENFIRSHGGELAFSTIVAFGANAAIPHHLSQARYKLQKTDLILIDMGAKVEGYCADMTRTIFIGKPNKTFEKMYTATKEAQEVAIDYLKTHMQENFDVKKPHILANSHLKALGFSDIPHGLGHGVGLQVHEEPTLSPFSEQQLSPGMVVTVEPGVYIPDVGGVRIEDTILVTPNGVEILTKSPKELTVI